VAYGLAHIEQVYAQGVALAITYTAASFDENGILLAGGTFSTTGSLAVKRLLQRDIEDLVEEAAAIELCLQPGNVEIVSFPPPVPNT
jgi:hypothetical protein